MRERIVHKRQIVLYQGEATTQFYLIKSGIVRAYTILENDTEMNIALYGPGDFFPSSASTSRVAFSVFYYETMSPAVLEAYPAEEFATVKRKLLAEQPEYWSHRYLGALLHINALAQVSAARKIAYGLQYLAIRFGAELMGGKYTRIDMKLTQQDIAALCGVSRETTNLELGKLRDKNILTEKSKFYSIDMKALTKLLGDDAIQNIEL